MHLHYESERDHRRVEHEEHDQASQVVYARQHGDDDDHDRGAEGVLDPASEVDPVRQISVIPTVDAGQCQQQMRGTRNEQERGDQWREPEIAERVRVLDELLDVFIEAEKAGRDRQGEVGAQDEHEDTLRVVNGRHQRVEQAEARVRLVGGGAAVRVRRASGHRLRRHSSSYTPTLPRRWLRTWLPNRLEMPS